MLYILHPWTHTRKPDCCVLAGGCDDSQDCMLVNQIHTLDLYMLDMFIPLADAVPIDPKIVVSEVHGHIHRVSDCCWKEFGQ